MAGVTTTKKIARKKPGLLQIAEELDDLPQTFHPNRFEPIEWARLAKVAGIK